MRFYSTDPDSVQCVLGKERRVFNANAVDSETGHDFTLISLYLSEAEFRIRMSRLGLFISSMSPAQFRDDGGSLHPPMAGEVGQALATQDIARMERATLLRTTRSNDRHFLLQSLAEALRKEAARKPAMRKHPKLKQEACLHRSLELGWQWLLEAPELVRGLRASMGGELPQLPVASGLALTLKRQGHAERSRWVHEFADAL